MDEITKFKNIQQHSLNLFKRKNYDYGMAYKKYGLIGLLIRLNDKINRLITIKKNNIHLVKNESLSDTIMDIHNYCALALMCED